MCEKLYFSLLEIDLVTMKMPFNHKNSIRMDSSVKITRTRPRNQPFDIEYDFE